ncbi:hypothetical protein [Desertibacillus haloalkaliphilus]|uniref:hypothetical protein n=1 Tax=Desertibacillus haloalkaliphilus TaxID=1328930 RepID=UPI001C279D21|nr:hypothetical protein [Desertibacillus haloalkaliphilus]MBU8906631.1 hypothetical protein [Desertibacillus haloalkaliphilus]
MLVKQMEGNVRIEPVSTGVLSDEALLKLIGMDHDLIGSIQKGSSEYSFMKVFHGDTAFYAVLAIDRIDYPVLIEVEKFEFLSIVTDVEHYMAGTSGKDDLYGAIKAIEEVAHQTRFNYRKKLAFA